MMEFFLSKLWAMLCGVMLLGICTASVTDLGHASADAADQAALEALAENMESAFDADGDFCTLFDLDSLLIDENDALIVRSNSIWLVGPDHSYARTFVNMPTIIGWDGRPIDTFSSLTLRQGSLLKVERHTDGSLTISPQSAKVEATLRMALTNAWQSSSSL